MKNVRRSVAVRCFTVVLIVCFESLVTASPIGRMDIFDAADNRLMFVTFEYNGSGECIRRDVFAGDSTFLRSTTVTPQSATEGGKETSVDYEGNTQFVTTIDPPSDGATSFSTVDQFGLSQYGSPLQYQESASNTFTVTQDNTTLCTQQYEYDDNDELTRITVNDKSGNLSWYAQISRKDVSVQRQRTLPVSNRVDITANRGTLRLSFGLSAGGTVGCELISPAGRKVLDLLHRRFTAGNHRFVVSDVAVSNGMYIMRMTVDGMPAATRMVVVQQ